MPARIRKPQLLLAPETHALASALVSAAIPRNEAITLAVAATALSLYNHVVRTPGQETFHAPAADSRAAESDALQNPSAQEAANFYAQIPHAIRPSSVALVGSLADAQTVNRALHYLRRVATAALQTHSVSAAKGAEQAAYRTAPSTRSTVARLPGELYEWLLHTPLTDDPAGQEELRAGRLASGSFYTPSALVDRMVALVEPTISDRILDPAMGCGYFLLGCIEALSGELPPPDLQKWATRALHGQDINPGAVAVARLCLWLRLSTQQTPFLPSPEQFCVADTLLQPLPMSGYDCVIGNPPYDVLTNFARRPENAAYAKALRDSGNYTDALQGQLNLYRCFIERGLQLLKPAGRLCYIVPATLTADKTAGRLRQELLDKHAADHFCFLKENDPRFPGICQSTVIFRARRDAGPACQVVIDSAGCATRLSRKELREWEYRIPRTGAAGLRLHRWLTEHCAATFSDLCTARVGEVDQTVYRDFIRNEPTGSILLRGCHLRPFYADLGENDPCGRYLDAEGFLLRAASKRQLLDKLLSQPRVIQLGIRNLCCRPRLVTAILPAGIYCGNSINVYLPRAGTSLALLAGLLSSRLYDLLFRLNSTNNNINLHEVLRLPAPSLDRPDLVRGIEEAYRCCAEAAGSGGAADAFRTTLDTAVEDALFLPHDLRTEVTHLASTNL